MVFGGFLFNILEWKGDRKVGGGWERGQGEGGKKEEEETYEKTFKPCLTSSSANILKKPYRTPFSRRRPTRVRLKPHWGALGVPFINSMTGAALTSSARRLLSSSAGSSAAGATVPPILPFAGVTPPFSFPPVTSALSTPLSLGVASSAGGKDTFPPAPTPPLPLPVPPAPALMSPALPAYFSTSSLIFPASLPEILPSTCLPRCKTKNGTAVTSYDSEISLSDSASRDKKVIWGGLVMEYEDASVCRMRRDWAQGAAQDVWKDMQAIVVGAREAMWDSKASAESTSWMVDMFTLVGTWRIGSLRGMSARVVWKIWYLMGVEYGNCNEERREFALRLHDLIW